MRLHSSENDLVKVFNDIGLNTDITVTGSLIQATGATLTATLTH